MMGNGVVLEQVQSTKVHEPVHVLGEYKLNVAYFCSVKELVLGQFLNGSLFLFESALLHNKEKTRLYTL